MKANCCFRWPMPQKGQEKIRLPMIWQGRRVDQPQQQNDDPRLI